MSLWPLLRKHGFLPTKLQPTYQYTCKNKCRYFFTRLNCRKLLPKSHLLHTGAVVNDKSILLPLSNLTASWLLYGWRSRALLLLQVVNDGCVLCPWHLFLPGYTMCQQHTGAHRIESDQENRGRRLQFHGQWNNAKPGNLQFQVPLSVDVEDILLFTVQ